jgi:hypothetical protein
VGQSLAKGQSADSWRDTFAQSVEDCRRDAQERIRKERERLQELDAQLTAKLDEVTTQLSAAQQWVASSAATGKGQEAALQGWQQRLEERERQWERKKAELEAERDRAKTSLQEQVELNRRQAEESRHEALRHAAQLEQVRQEAREDIERLREADAAGPSLAFALNEKLEPLLSRLNEQDAVLNDVSRKLDEQAAVRASALPEEAAAELAALRAENKTLSSRLNEAPAVRKQLEPVLTRLTEQETVLGQMSRKLDEQIARKKPSVPEEIVAELATLRQENKSQAARLAEAAGLNKHLDPLLARLTEQDSLLSEMSQKLDQQAARRASSLPEEAAAELAALRQENKSLTAQLHDSAAFNKSIEPLFARLTEQESLLSLLSKKLDEQAAQKPPGVPDEMTAVLAALREENKSLTVRFNEAIALSKYMEPLLVRLTEQESLLGQMSQKLDNQAAQLTRTTTDETRAELAALREETKKLADSVVAPLPLSEQMEPLLARLAEQEAMFSEFSRKLDEQATRQAAALSEENASELAALRQENRALAERLGIAENAVSRKGSEDNEGPELDDLRRRFEMAVQDVRELKTKNADLAEQLSRAKQAAGAATPSSGDGTGWESLKQKLLSELESDFDNDDAQQKADRLTVEGAIKITDDVVAEKEREVAELRRLLDSQAQQVGDVAVGAAAVAQLLDTDELVRQERESLKRLQETLREQSKQAEIDLSLERAKLARERLELEEKMRSMESEKAQLSLNASDSPVDKTKPGNKRKWLTRLGLGENKEE